MNKFGLFKRTLAGVLSALMIVSSAPVGAFAAEVPADEQLAVEEVMTTATEDENIATSVAETEAEVTSETESTEEAVTDAESESTETESTEEAVTDAESESTETESTEEVVTDVESETESDEAAETESTAEELALEAEVNYVSAPLFTYRESDNSYSDYCDRVSVPYGTDIVSLRVYRNSEADDEITDISKLTIKLYDSDGKVIKESNSKDENGEIYLNYDVNRPETEDEVSVSLSAKTNYQNNDDNVCSEPSTFTVTFESNKKSATVNDADFKFDNCYYWTLSDDGDLTNISVAAADRKTAVDKDNEGKFVCDLTGSDTTVIFIENPTNDDGKKYDNSTMTLTLVGGEETVYQTSKVTVTGGEKGDQEIDAFCIPTADIDDKALIFGMEPVSHSITCNNADIKLNVCAVDEEGVTDLDEELVGAGDGDTVTFVANAVDSAHLSVVTISKKSGTAAFSKKAVAGKVYYELKNVKGDVVITGTTKRVALSDAPSFTVTNNTEGRATVKVTGATYNASEQKYTVNKGATVVTIAVTETAPYVSKILNNVNIEDISEHPEALIKADSVKPAAGKYVHTYSIPAVDLTEKTLNIYDETVEKTVKIAYNESLCSVAAKIDGVDATSSSSVGFDFYTCTVPFGSKLTIIPTALDNCKVLNMTVAGKKVAVPKAGYTITVTEDREDISVVSQALRETRVFDEGTLLVSKNYTYNVNKTNTNIIACIREGCYGMVDLSNKTIEAKVGTKAVSEVVTLDENNTDLKFNFNSEECAGKTVVVTVKDGKTLLTALKFNVSAYITNVTVKGEKTVKEGDNKIQVITQDFPMNKTYAVSFNKGVDPNDVKMEAFVLYGDKTEKVDGIFDFDPNNNILSATLWNSGPLMSYLFDEEGNQTGRFAVCFYDTTKPMANQLVAVKYIQPSVDYLKKIKPTMKIVRTTDRYFDIELSYPKQLNGYETAFRYYIEANAADEKHLDPGMYPNVEYGNVELSDKVICLDMCKGGEGIETKYNISAKLVFAVNYSSAEAILKNQKTKNPAYETKLGAKNIQTNIYSGEKNVNIAYPTYSAKTTYYGLEKAELIDKNKEVVYSSKNSGSKLRISSDEVVYITDTSELEAGKYTLVLYAIQENGKTPASKSIPITIFEPITGILPTVAVNNLYKDTNKVLTIAPKVSIYNATAKTKKVTWDYVIAGGVLSDEEEAAFRAAVTFAPTTGKFTLKKGYTIPKKLEITLTAHAADFEENDVYGGVSVNICPTVAPLENVKVFIGENEAEVDDNGVYLVSTAGYESYENLVRVVVSDEGFSDYQYTYISSNRRVASIDKTSGYLGLVNSGETSITITSTDGGNKKKVIKIKLVMGAVG